VLTMHPRMHIVLLLAIVAGGLATSVTYTIELNEWIVDYARPTAAPRIVPYKIAMASKQQSLLANNSFPGPAINANQGDTIEVTVLNNLMKDDISMVFEGLKVLKAPAGFITPQGGLGSYTLAAPQVGTFLWHASLSLQTASGLFGPVAIHNQTQVPPSEVTVVLADARAAPNVCFNGADQWDVRSCPDIDKATLNGQFGDGSKAYPAPVVEVQKGECYLLRLLGVSMLPGSVFDFSVQDHHFSLPGGQRNLPTLTTPPNGGISAVFCADQEPILDHDYSITYSLYNASNPSDKKAFTGILRYA